MGTEQIAEVVATLRSGWLSTGPSDYTLHLHPYYREKLGYKKGDFPNAEDVIEAVRMISKWSK